MPPTRKVPGGKGGSAGFQFLIKVCLNVLKSSVFMSISNPLASADVESD